MQRQTYQIFESGTIEDATNHLSSNSFHLGTAILAASIRNDPQFMRLLMLKFPNSMYFEEALIRAIINKVYIVVELFVNNDDINSSLITLEILRLARRESSDKMVELLLTDTRLQTLMNK
jgi:hypothetical protein